MKHFDHDATPASPRTASRSAALLPAAALALLLPFAALAGAAQVAAQTAPAVTPTAPATTPAPADAKKPQLTVDEPVYETGEVARDKVVEHTFVLRNTGDAVLNIGAIVRPSNVEVISQPTALAPGESGELKVRVPLLNDKPLALLKQILVRSDDPVHPETKVELKILSTEYVVVKPGYARWISVQHEKAGTISQVLSARDGQPLEVLRTTEPPAGISSNLTVSQKTASGAAKEWKLDLTLAADAPIGAIVGTMLVYVNHPKQSIVPIPLSGFMRPVLAVTPPALSVGELQLTEKGAQAFTLKSYSTAPVRVTKVEHDLKGFAPATLEERVAGREYRMKLEFDPATLPKGPFRGTLSIHTDSATMPLVTVPIDGTIK